MRQDFRTFTKLVCNQFLHECHSIVAFFSETLGNGTCRPIALNTLQRCIDEGQSRMRNFQRALVADGLKLEACPFSKILDVDHATDIAKAEAFLQSSEEK